MRVTSRRTVVSDWRDWTRQIDWTGLIFFVFAVLLSTFILIFLPSSSVSLSYFNLAVPMRKCSGEHSCMSSPFSIIYHNFLPAPRRGSHVKLDNTNTIINIHPLAHILDICALMFSSCALFTVFPNRIM